RRCSRRLGAEWRRQRNRALGFPSSERRDSAANLSVFCLLKVLSSERREAPQANLSSVFSNRCPLNPSARFSVL
ncbi:MAG: hypothetical protein LBD06_02625, partial [Candidatus Accumulibacter sp.]|nr:hypothetical protein [Accumulibacter sp.]